MKILYFLLGLGIGFLTSTPTPPNMRSIMRHPERPKSVVMTHNKDRAVLLYNRK